MRTLLSLFIVFLATCVIGQNKIDETGRKQGNWKIYEKTNVGMANEDSILVAEGSFKNSRKNGMWKFYKDGVLDRIQNFKFDRKLGRVEYYYPNGNLREVGLFKKGKYNGADLKYHENGCLYYQLHRDSLDKKMIELYFNEDCNGGKRGSIKDSVSYIKEDNRVFKDESLFKIGTTHHGELIKGKYESMANKADANDCFYKEEIKLLGENYSGSNEIKDANGNTLVVGVFENGEFATGEMHCYDADGKLIKSKYYEDKKIMRVTRH